MSKPSVVTLPFVLLLLDYWPLERFGNLRDWRTIWRMVFEKIPFFGLSVISGIVTFLGQKAVGTVATIDQAPLLVRLTNAIVSYGTYIGKCFWPSGLAVLYPLEREIVIWKVVVAAAGLIAVSVFVVRYMRRSRYLLIGL